MIRRLLALFAILAGISAVVAYAPHFSLAVGDVPVANSLKVKAQDLTLVCPGAVYRTGGATGTRVGAFEQVGAPSLASSFNGPTGTALQTGQATFKALDPAGIADQNSILLNANQIQPVAEGTLQGLTGASCERPTNDLWFLGGDTSTGRESLLVVRNVTKVDATVSLEIFDQGGQVTGSGMSGISVPAGKTTVIPLASYAPKNPTFTTHVVSQGGLIAAWIQQKAVRGLASGGIDYVSPSPGFAKNQVIPGVFIRGAADAAKLISKPDFADLVPTLRVYVPGKQAATVTAQVLGSTAKTYGTVVRQTIQGGTTADIALPGLLDGDYVAIVKSDVPVGSSIRLHRVVKTAVDFTWLTSAQAQNSEVGLTIPAIGISKLSLANPQGKTLEIQLIQGVTAPAKFQIPAQGQLTLTFAPGAKVRLAANGGSLFGNLIVDVSGAVAAIPLVDYKNPGGQVAVMVR